MLQERHAEGIFTRGVNISAAKMNKTFWRLSMPAFARSFPSKALTDWDAANPGNAVRALFDRWALPGCRATGDVRLRLGVRDGYLNFYIKGQSVAKLSCGRNGPQLSVHDAYVEGRRSEHSDRRAPSQTYRSYDASSLVRQNTAALIPGWIETALTYASAEKRFVDDLIGANAGVIDLEMGLPASDLPNSARVAPRMDLVVAEATGSVASVVFWEAKCANNSELRSSRDFVRLDDGDFTGPKVLNQLWKYVTWMGEPGRDEQVRSAYRMTAAVFLDLYSSFVAATNEAPDCVAVWQKLAHAPDLAIVSHPGVVIGNYWPADSSEGIASGRMGQAARSFARNGHREKLEREGLRIHEVNEDDDSAVLPILAEAKAA